MKHSIPKFIKDVRGNIAITAAFAMLPIMIGVGAALDYSRVVQLTGKLSQAADAALLSAASTVMKQGLIDNSGTVTASQLQNINSQLNNFFDRFFKSNVGINSNGISYTLSYDPATQDVRVVVNMEYKTAFSGFVTPNVNLQAKAAINMTPASQGALSMYLVLDKSGSMGWYNRMNTLKIAIADMANQFEAKDPQHKYVRLGAIAYDSYKRYPSTLTWGSAAANNYVQRLVPIGGTNSYPAMLAAYNSIANKREDEAHEQKNQKKPKKYIVLLTDGANNRSYYDYYTLQVCGNAKNAAIEVYTVAFQAPASGQNLLRACASSPAHYFKASNAKDLIKAFRQIGAAASNALRLTN